MKKQICLILLFFTCRNCIAQNLVPNGNFEQLLNCPYDLTQLDFSQNWFNPSVNSAQGGSPDYYNQCDSTGFVGVPINNFGIQLAHSGVGYAGLCTYFTILSGFREYIEVQLTSTLNSGTCYNFQMFVNLCDKSAFTSDDIAVYFSDTAVAGINNWYPLTFAPQIINPSGNYPDSLTWTAISGNYVSTGGEKFIIIGNFKDDANTTSFLVNSTTTIPFTYFYIDDVSLSPCTGIEEQGENTIINIFPNPINDKLNVQIENNEVSEINLYNIISKKVIHQEFTNSVTIDTEQLSKGIYIYEVKNKHGVVRNGR